MTDLNKKYGEIWKQELLKRQEGDSEEITKDEIAKICEAIVRALESKIQEELAIKRNTLATYFSVYIELYRDKTGMWEIKIRKDANTIEVVETYISKMCYSSKETMFEKIKEQLKEGGIRMDLPKEFEKKAYCILNLQS